MINRIEKNTLYRSIVHVSSLIFLFVFLFIFTHQQMWIKGIMQHYFEVNIRSLLLFFSASDRFQTLKDYLLQMGMEMVGWIAVELLIIVTGLSIVGYFLWKLRVDRWYLSEKILAAGYLILVGSSVVVLVKMGVEGYQTYSTIVHSVNQLSMQEIRDLQTQLTSAFFDTSFSVDGLIANLASLLEQIRSIIQKTNEIAAIPSLLSQSWNQILLLKDSLIGCVIAAVLVIVIAHGLALINLLKKNNYIQMKLKMRKNTRQNEINEHLNTVTKQQKELIDLLSKKD